MDEELKRIRDDFLSLMVELNDQAKAEDRIEKAHIAQVLAMLAGSIQEEELEGLAREVTDWSKINLKNWKAKGS